MTAKLTDFAIRLAQVGVIGLISLPTSLSAQATISWRLTEELRFGSQHHADSSLTTIGQVLIGRNGNVFVTQPQDDQIIVFDSAGALVRRTGRSGNGPGEYRVLSRIGLLGDSIWVLDRGLNRVTLLTAEGEILSVWPYRAPEDSDTRRPISPGAVLSDGNLLAVSDAPPFRFGIDLVRPVYVLRFDRSGTILNSFGEIPVVPFAAQFQLDGRVINVTPLRVTGPTGSWAVSPNGSLLALIAPAQSRDDGAYEIRVLRSDGRPFARLGSIALPVQRSRQQLEAARSSLVDGLIATGLSRPDADRIAEQVPIPRTESPIHGLMLDADDRLWLAVRSTGGTAPTTWRIFDTRLGVEIASVEVDAAIRPMAAERSTLWAMRMDELGVSYLVRYRITQ